MPDQFASQVETVLAMLARVGAHPGQFFGSRVFRCPCCSDQRKKKSEKCLSVKSDADGFVFYCHHCEWHGGSRGAAERTSAPRPSSTDDSDQHAMQEWAFAIWQKSDDPRGTMIDRRYFPSRRSHLILPAEICGTVVRFHPALSLVGQRAPGMVTLLRNIHTDQPQAIERTFLAGDGSKITRKKLGPAAGAAIKISADEDVTTGLIIGEGFETCLAAYIRGLRPVWAAGSKGGIRAFPVLPSIESLTILGERNDDGANAEAAQDCADRWIDAGREVILADPLTGDDFDDAMREVAP
ncbi:hypothetical protein AS156_30075 [Bradyrhizobium macuxiense]|uniref:Uncharacterized protein n=1 Tax=Bradyrhizobium macuxiense TaxID=1755647 RepID=A0A109K3M1_9BRAD|nr:toprim domain-containing protein [Bradyrhizobium macuxiense]KWV60189.1 hypothetical protein AS156_30075 [Bradyrhizobium macuxiense]